MKYLFLVHGGEQQIDAMPRTEQEDFAHARLFYEELLRKNGHLLAVEDIQDSCSWTTLWIEKGEVVLSDGATCKAKQWLIRLFLISARDLNEAIRLAAKIPQMPGDSIEVRLLTERA